MCHLIVLATVARRRCGQHRYPLTSQGLKNLKGLTGPACRAIVSGIPITLVAAAATADAVQPVLRHVLNADARLKVIVIKIGLIDAQYPAAKSATASAPQIHPQEPVRRWFTFRHTHPEPPAATDPHACGAPVSHAGSDPDRAHGAQRCREGSRNKRRLLPSDHAAADPHGRRRPRSRDDEIATTRGPSRAGTGQERKVAPAGLEDGA